MPDALPAPEVVRCYLDGDFDPPLPALALRWDADGSYDASEAKNQVWTDADDAVARHPAGRGKAADGHAAPKGPDDDPEFLRALDRAIRRNPPVS